MLQTIFLFSLLNGKCKEQLGKFVLFGWLNGIPSARVHCARNEEKERRWDWYWKLWL